MENEKVDNGAVSDSRGKVQMRQEGLGGKYFGIKTDVYIGRGPMIVLTIFTGLVGIPNFITKRYLQGVVHLVMFFFVFLGTPFGWCLLAASYVLAFFETIIYNQQINRLQNDSVSFVEKIESTSLSVLEIINIVSLCLLLSLELVIIMLGYFTNAADNSSGWALFYTGPLLLVGLGVLVASFCYQIFIFIYNSKLKKRGKLKIKHMILLCAGTILFVVDVMLLVIAMII